MRVDPIPELQPFRLICRPMPLDGESWPDYVIRLAEENCIKGGLRAMAYLAGMYVNQLLIAAPSEVLLRFGIILSEIYQEHPLDVPMDRKLTLLVTYGRCNKTRLCPLCLAADDIPFIRAEWGMPMSIACPHHRTLLIDKCQLCGERLDVFRPGLLQCHCGARLHEQIPLPTESWVDRLRDLFAEAYVAQEVLTFARAHPLGQKAARVCKWVLAACVPETGRRPAAVLDMGGFLTCEDAISVGRMLGESASDIAKRFMDEVHVGSPKKYQRLNQRLGTRFFSQMAAVVEEVKQLQLQLVDPNRRRVEQRAEAMERNDVYALTDVMALTGYCHATLARAVEQGELDGRIAFDEVLGRNYIQIPGPVYRTIEAAYQQSVDLLTAATHAGCSEHAMMGLVHSKLVRAVRPLLIRRGVDGVRVRQGDWQEFTAHLFGAAEFENEHRFRRVYFSDWGSGKNLIRISRKLRKMMAAIKEGRIRVFKAVEHPTALDELYVAPKDLIKVLDLRGAPRIRRVSRPAETDPR